VHASGRFTRGEVVGPDGETHWVVSHNGEAIELLTPFRDLSPGDVVTVYPGCSHDLAACSGFSNLAHFLGFPWAPTKNPYVTGA
jgi:hypothetical protein